ncbi:glycosyl hydrolase family 8 [Alicyclobacillus ferrooxydans]|uniref:glycosyl hydrolase family 8 n=1 Tax=Alicyclobacillus ferrooxydans TaxID=471514 RepID=UPI0006D576B2|nr:glycosyl hydrolase family 8 [Alicyclobacillus ferrooxydans]
MKKTAKLGMSLLSAAALLTPITSLAATTSQTAQPTSWGIGTHPEGAYQTGVYPNLFKQAGYTQKQINEKVNADFQQLFHGDPGTASQNYYDGQALYYQMTPDMAYIASISSYPGTKNPNDVRTEGMGYGMMIAVQLNHKKEFDSLWNYAKTYMQIKSGPTKGEFAWHTYPDGQVIDYGVAPDGDQWIAAALAFAAGRWGNGEGIYNYQQQSKQILQAMWHDPAPEFSHTTYLPVFSPPYATSYTDPSYSLPAFYKIFASVDPSDKQLWNKAYTAGETLLANAYNPQTGLAPDYSNFNGTPYIAPGETASDLSYDHNFEFDAFRVIANANVDAAWFGVKPWETTYSNTLENFFYPIIDTYGNNYALDGTELSSSSGHSPGLVAMNASSAISATNPDKMAFVQALWNTPLPTGQWRYYDGLLTMLGTLYDSGNFKIWWHPVENRAYPQQ